MFNYSTFCRWGLLFGAGLLLMAGCRKEQDPIQPPSSAVAGKEYYPLAVGRYWEYDVVDHYWQYNVDSVVRYQLRERVDTVYTGATGEINFRIVRSLRSDSTNVWRDDSTAAVVLTPELVRRTFSNVPTLSLLFPVEEGRYWNPNLFNASDSTTRRYERVGQSLTLGNGRRFDKTIQVVDEALISEVERREQSAAYAWNVGCIYRKRRVLDYCNQNEVGQGLCQIGTGYIVRGAEREEQLRAWGPR
jgi:hypothetical protein